MFCSSCGNKIIKGEFCQFCGKKINNKESSHKKNKTLFISVIVLLFVAIIIGICVFVSKIFFKKDNLFDDNTLTLTGFKCSSEYLVSDVADDIVFTVKSNKEAESIFLYEGEKKIVQMRDDGKNGDFLANDHIYTCKINFNKSFKETTSLSYYCKSNGLKSDSISIYCFAKLSEEDAYDAQQKYEDLSLEIQYVEDNYKDNTGYVPKKNYSELFEAIINEVELYQRDGVVLFYKFDDNSLYIKMTSGLSLVYAPKTINTDSIGNDGSVTIMTMQPCFTQMGGSEYGREFTGYKLPDDVDYALEMIDVSAQNINNALSNYHFSNDNNYNDQAVTLEKIRSISKNQVVLWHGHGYFGPVVKSCLVTGESFNWYAWWWDIEYFGDCVADRIVKLYGCEEVIISSKYIEKYCGDMTDSFIYLAACDSGREPELANAFTKKGAVVVANTKTIIRDYNVAMLYGIVNEMIKINPNNGKLYTLSEALNNAKQIYGENDADSRYGGEGSTPIIFGGDKANNYRFVEQVTGNSNDDNNGTDKDTAVSIEDDDELTVIGRISKESYEINSNNKGTVYILTFETPMKTLLFSDVLGYNGFEETIDSVQLDIYNNEYELYKDKIVTVTGNVMFGHTGHHRREIVLTECQIKTDEPINIELSDNDCKELEDLILSYVRGEISELDDIRLSSVKMLTIHGDSLCVINQEVEQDIKYYIDEHGAYNFNALGQIVNKMPLLEHLDICGISLLDVNDFTELKKLESLTLVGGNISQLNGIENLTNLVHLDLSNNLINDISAIKDLKKLKSLWLVHNSITDISVLEYLTNLESLDIAFNDIRDISCIGRLNKLTELFIYNNRIKDISSLSNLTNLIILDAWNNEIVDIKALENLTELNQLIIYNNQIGDISSISGLTQLKELWLWGNNITDINALYNLTNLEELLIHNNQISNIDSLSRLTNLTELWLGNNNIKDITVLGNLTNLKTLEVSNCNVSSIDVISGLSKLEILCIENNNISEDDINKLRKSLVNCDIFSWNEMPN